MINPCYIKGKENDKSLKQGKTKHQNEIMCAHEENDFDFEDAFNVLNFIVKSHLSYLSEN